MKSYIRLFILFLCAVLVLSFYACGGEVQRGADTPQEAVKGFMEAIAQRDSDLFNSFCLVEFEKTALQKDLHSGAWDDYLEDWQGDTVAIEEYPDNMLPTGQKIIYREYQEFFDSGAPIDVNIDTSSITKFCAVYINERNWLITAQLADRWYVDVLTSLDGYFGY